MWARRNCANGWFVVPIMKAIDEPILVFVSNTRRNPEKDDGDGWWLEDGRGGS
jgi:hypothetical protein